MDLESAPPRPTQYSYPKICPDGSEPCRYCANTGGVWQELSKGYAVAYPQWGDCMHCGGTGCMKPLKVPLPRFLGCVAIGVVVVVLLTIAFFVVAFIRAQSPP